jgi:hypothetical protein
MHNRCAPCHGGDDVGMPLVDALENVRESLLICHVSNRWNRFELLEGLHIPISYLNHWCTFREFTPTILGLSGLLVGHGRQRLAPQNVQP